MNTAPWPQEIVLKPMEDILTSTNSNTSAGYNNTTSLPNHNTTATTTAKPPSSQPSTPSERKVRPQKDEALNCPRCNSTNTKFCYYNNYSLAQPRYFCKTCRRYWTAGGSLRNIPVGGGSRKNKRSSPSSIITSAGVSKIKLPDLIVAPPNSSSNTNPNNSSNTAPHGKINIFHHHEGQDLNLGFPSTLSEFMNLPNIENTTDKNSSHMSALELLTGLTSSASRAPFNSFMMPIQQQMSSSDHDPYPTTGFSLQGTVSDHHFKPTTLGFSLGNEGGYGMQSQSGNGRMLFPFQDLNSTEEASARISNTSTTTATAASSGHQQNYSHDDAANDQQIVKDVHHQGTGYWSGMLGGAGSW